MMDSLVELRNGWVWPKDDSNCWNYMMSHPDLPKKISSHVHRKNVCIQAGGNAGFYVKQYADCFSTVYTFEPEPLNFYCLNRNITNQNVFKFQSCIGNSRDLVKLKIKAKNRGKNHVAGAGDIPTLLIDDLNLNECNLIHLDIEGYEFFALKGAANTIKRCRPVIVFEYFEKCIEKFNYSLTDVELFLSKLGYKLVQTYNEERVYKPKIGT